MSVSSVGGLLQIWVMWGIMSKQDRKEIVAVCTPSFRMYP